MDQKKANQLDPKLKEVYERVMGTTVAQQPTTPPPAQAPSQTTQTEPPPHVVHVAAAPTHTVVSAGSVTKKENSEKKSPVSIPILILAGIVFLLVYALVWVKVFNFKLPFLP